MIHGFIKGSIVLMLLFAIALSAAFIYAYQEIRLDADKLINYKPEISTVLLDRNGEQLAYVFKKHHRLYARYDEIPGDLIEALIAVEDTQFFEHPGINVDAIIRAIVIDIKERKFAEGGSTLTQQLIKNKLLTSEKKLARKLKEVVLALKIENALTKEEILERYLNEIFFGNGYYGVKTASKGYFHKDLHELTLKESAMLVGLPNAPSYLNPVKHYKRSLTRANSVLYRMKSIGWVSEEAYIKAIKETPKIYQATLTQNIAPYIVDEVLRSFKGHLGDIRTGGYQIYTTIDIKQQEIAKEALLFAYKKAMVRYKENPNTSTLNAALISVESKTGDILAMAGGVNYAKNAYNNVTQTVRQPGSAFKPFVYQTALDMGYNPATMLADLARTFQYYKNGERVIWSPQNYEGNFQGPISFRDALVFSRNLATVNLVYDLGVSAIRNRLALLDVKDIPTDMSISLGNLGLSPLKMAQIFSVFANYGHMIEPRLVSKIISKEGAVIFETRPKEIADFTEPQQAYLMTDMLKDAIMRGTGKSAQVQGIELAGKTGTTNENIDAWFCGYSPTIETIVWFGRDDNRPIGQDGTGGIIAAPAFAYYYKKLLQYYPNTPRVFKKPEGLFEGIANGKSELYTSISPLPRSFKFTFDAESRQEANTSDAGQIENQNPTMAQTQPDSVQKQESASGEDDFLQMFGETGDSPKANSRYQEDQFFDEDQPDMGGESSVDGGRVNNQNDAQSGETKAPISIEEDDGSNLF